VGTLKGVVHALELSTGKDIWSCTVGFPVVHTLAADETRVHEFAVDGSATALNLRNGSVVWKKTSLKARLFSSAASLGGKTLYWKQGWDLLLP